MQRHGHILLKRRPRDQIKSIRKMGIRLSIARSLPRGAQSPAHFSLTVRSYLPFSPQPSVLQTSVPLTSDPSSELSPSQGSRPVKAEGHLSAHLHGCSPHAPV